MTWGLAHLSEPAEAITAELVTNAITASGRTALPGAVPQPVMLWASAPPGRGELCIRVWDPDPAPPPRDDTGDIPDLWAESGRGLFIVAAYSSRWSWYPAHGGKYVWAALPLRPQPPAR